MKKSKNAVVDIIKFICAIAIMLGHFYGHTNGWLVEFFLFATGYYTLVHYERLENSSEVEEPVMMYWFSKFSKFWPYTVLTSVLVFIYKYGGLFRNDLYGFVNKLVYLPVDAFCLNIFFPDKLIEENSLWTLVGMMAAFPIVCLICMIKNDNVVTVFSIAFAVLYYPYLSVQFGSITESMPQRFFRCLAGMLVGVGIRQIVKLHSNYEKTMYLFLIGIGCMMIAFVSGLCFNVKLVTIAVEIIGSRMLLDDRISFYKGNRFTDLLGKLSMIIYIIHFAVFYYIQNIPVIVRFPIIAGGIVILIAYLLHLLVGKMLSI